MVNIHPKLDKKQKTLANRVYRDSTTPLTLEDQHVPNVLLGGTNSQPVHPNKTIANHVHLVIMHPVHLYHVQNVLLDFIKLKNLQQHGIVLVVALECIHQIKEHHVYIVKRVDINHVKY